MPSFFRLDEITAAERGHDLGLLLDLIPTLPQRRRREGSRETATVSGV